MGRQKKSKIDYYSEYKQKLRSAEETVKAAKSGKINKKFSTWKNPGDIVISK